MIFPKLVGARATRTTNQTIPWNAYTVVSFDTTTWDRGLNGLTVYASDKFTAPATGYYLCCGQIEWSGSNVTNTRIAVWRKNGGALGAAGQAYSALPADTFGVFQNVQQVIQLNRGDYVELMVYQDAGGSVTQDIIANGCHAAVVLQGA